MTVCRIAAELGLVAAAVAGSASLSASSSHGPAVLAPPIDYASQLEISEGGTISAQALKQITAGGDGVGLRTYDPGCVLFCPCPRLLCGHAGRLRCRCCDD